MLTNSAFSKMQGFDSTSSNQLSDPHSHSLDVQIPSSIRVPPTCIVCQQRERQSRLNCGHQICCFRCSERLETCPVCREPLTDCSILDSRHKVSSWCGSIEKSDVSKEGSPNIAHPDLAAIVAQLEILRTQFSIDSLFTTDTEAEQPQANQLPVDSLFQPDLETEKSQVNLSKGQMSLSKACDVQQVSAHMMPPVKAPPVPKTKAPAMVKANAPSPMPKAPPPMMQPSQIDCTLQPLGAEPLNVSLNHCKAKEHGLVEHELEPGSTVRIHSLATAAKLNGMNGICERWDSARRRWHVRLRNGEVKAFKLENVRWLEVTDVPLQVGNAVIIHNLTVASDLNGLEGVCEQWDPKKDRWNVRLKGGEIKALKEHNLQRLEVGNSELQCGVDVFVHGLSVAIELNGVEGTCKQWDPWLNQLLVRLSSGKVKAFKPHNLRHAHSTFHEAPHDVPQRSPRMKFQEQAHFKWIAGQDCPRWAVIVDDRQLHAKLESAEALYRCFLLYCCAKYEDAYLLCFSANGHSLIRSMSSPCTCSDRLDFTEGILSYELAAAFWETAAEVTNFSLQRRREHHFSDSCELNDVSYLCMAAASTNTSTVIKLLHTALDDVWTRHLCSFLENSCTAECQDYSGKRPSCLGARIQAARIQAIGQVFSGSQAKARLHAHNISTSGCLELHDFIELIASSANFSEVHPQALPMGWNTMLWSVGDILRAPFLALFPFVPEPDLIVPETDLDGGKKQEVNLTNGSFGIQ